MISIFFKNYEIRLYQFFNAVSYFKEHTNLDNEVYK